MIQTRSITVLKKIALTVFAIVSGLLMLNYSYQYTVSFKDTVLVVVYFCAGIGLSLLAGWFVKRSKYNIWMMPIYVILLLVLGIESGFLLTTTMNVFGVSISFVVGVISIYIKEFSVDKGLHLLGACILAVALGWFVIQLYDTPYKFMNKVAYETRNYLQEEGYDLSDDDAYYSTNSKLIDNRYNYDIRYFRRNGEALLQIIRLTYDQGELAITEVQDYDGSSLQVD